MINPKILVTGATQASVASWPSLNGGVSMRSPESPIVLAAAAKGKSRSFWAAAHAWLLDWFTAPPMPEVEPRRLPSVAFTPSGPLVYEWETYSDRMGQELRVVYGQVRRRFHASIDTLEPNE